MRSGNTIYIRTWQKCKICGGKFVITGLDMLCEKGCGTSPKRYFLDWHFNGIRFDKEKRDRYGQLLTSFVQAFDRASEIKKEIDEGRFQIENYLSVKPKLLKKYSIENVVKEYLDERKNEVSYDGSDENGLAPGGYRKIVEHLNEFSNWCIKEGNDDIRFIKSFEIRKFLNSLIGKNKAKTRKNKQTDIRKLFKCVRKWYGKDFVPDMPEFEEIKTVEPETKSIAREDQNKIIEKIPHVHRPVFEFMQDNGIRPAETRAIKHDAVLWDLEAIHIFRSFSEDYLREITKTKNQWYIYMSEKTREIVRKQPRSTQVDFLFWWNDRGKHKPYTEHMLRNIWNAARKEAGVDVICYDGIRHSFITQALEDGWQEDDVQAQVGHRCKATIRKYDHSKRIERLKRARGEG